jgi:mannose-1-phosphate guanylyltransferase
MKGMILTAGLGTRFKPITDYIPKPLIEIIDKPIIDFSIAQLRRFGIKEIILNIHHKKELIIEYFKANQEFDDMRIEFSHENELLGTSGGVKKAEPFFDEESFILLNSDMLFNLDISKLINFHNNNQADITLCLTDKGDLGKYGTLGVDDNFRIIRYLDTSISSKVRYTCIFKGIHVVSPGILKEIPENTFQDFSRHTYPHLLKKGYKICGYVSDEFWQPIGDLLQYQQVLRDVMNDRIPVDFPFPKINKKIYISSLAKIDPSVKINPPVIIAADTFIDSNCNIGPNTIIGPFCLIEANSSIINSVLYSKVRIEKGSEIKCKLCTPFIEIDF